MKKWLIPFLTLILIAGCSNTEKTDEPQETVADEIAFTMLASEKVLPDHFSEIGYTREESPFLTYMVIRVDDPVDFAKNWELFDLEGSLPEVNFEEHTVLFIGAAESGSCPMKLEKIERNLDRKTVSAVLRAEDGNCTSDATPRTYVAKLDRKALGEAESLQIKEDDWQTDVPFQ